LLTYPYSLPTNENIIRIDPSGKRLILGPKVDKNTLRHKFWTSEKHMLRDFSGKENYSERHHKRNLPSVEGSGFVH
jgi:hypothetical protein